MKIVLLNPNIDAEQRISNFLAKMGVAVLRPTNAQEALDTMLLHGQSLDLGIFHIEDLSGASTPGMELVKKLKADSRFKDFPYILTTSSWSDSQCATHQSGAEAANGYLRLPIDEMMLKNMIEVILEKPLQESIEKMYKTDLAIPRPTPQAQAQGAEPREVEQPPRISPPSFSPKKPPTHSRVNHQTPPSLPFSFEGGVELATNQNSDNGSELSIQLDAPQFVSEEASAPKPPAMESKSSESSTNESAPDRTIQLQVGTEKSMVLDQREVHASGEEDSQQVEAQSLGDNEVIELNSAELPVFEGLSLTPPPPLETDAAPLEASLDLGSPQSEEEPPAPPEEAQNLTSDEEVETQLPYLFGKGNDSSRNDLNKIYYNELSQPVGDAVVPGGATQSPDIETLKKYLLLREQDVGVLSNQLKSAKEHIQRLEDEVRTERSKSDALEQTLEQQKNLIEKFEEQKAALQQNFEAETQELRFQLRLKNDKMHSLENQIRQASDEVEQIKKRVRIDIQKIRVREKELENKLEMIKRDSEVLLAARENKVVELKRKIDLLEFNMDLLQDQYAKEKQINEEFKSRLGKASQAMKIAGGLLEDDADIQSQLTAENDEVSEKSELKII